MEFTSNWNGISKGQAVRLIRDVYQRQDGTPYGGIYYEEPGHLLMRRGSIGRFSAKTPKGVLVYFDSGVGGVLGLVLDEFAIEKHIGSR